MGLRSVVLGEAIAGEGLEGLLAVDMVASVAIIFADGVWFFNC